MWKIVSIRENYCRRYRVYGGRLPTFLLKGAGKPASIKEVFKTCFISSIVAAGGD
jgi:hypothetical protein